MKRDEFRQYFKKAKEDADLTRKGESQEISPGHSVRIDFYNNYPVAEHERKCQDCRLKNTMVYMADDDIWKSAGLDDGICCVGCLAKRLGRKLEITDFKESKVNRQIFLGYDIAKNE